ncbi:MAG TPA: ATP-binding protein [Terriglobia bacterium]|nr:ATP-binding protein [Terriglobia bacterium]
MDDARIPARYAHCELEGFGLTDKWRNESLERAKSLSERYAHEYPPSKSFGLLFMGPPGVGKTHLAVGIIRKLIRDKSIPCLFRTFPDLLKEIQMSYSPVSMSSELSLLQPVLEAEVLLLDELGAQTPSAWVKETVAYILNYRYAENKVTILTTNYLDQEDLKSPRKSVSYSLTERIGEPMRSRLYEMCKTVVMQGEDFRQRFKPDEHRL